MKLMCTLVAAATVGLLAAGTSSSMSHPRLIGTVGPGFTIKLTRFGKPFKTLPAGTYSITVADKSNSHNFHLRGPGVNKEITKIGFIGTKTVIVKFSKGKFTFICDPHATTMKGSFIVT